MNMTVTTVTLPATLAENKTTNNKSATDTTNYDTVPPITSLDGCLISAKCRRLKKKTAPDTGSTGGTIIGQSNEGPIA